MKRRASDIWTYDAFVEAFLYRRAVGARAVKCREEILVDRFRVEAYARNSYRRSVTDNPRETISLPESRVQQSHPNGIRVAVDGCFVIAVVRPTDGAIEGHSEPAPRLVAAVALGRAHRVAAVAYSKREKRQL